MRSASGSRRASTLPGSPPATSHDETVSPARSAAAPAVQSDTVPPRRPRSRRTGSRSPSGSWNGWLVWMVMASPGRSQLPHFPRAGARRSLVSRRPRRHTCSTPAVAEPQTIIPPQTTDAAPRGAWIAVLFARPAFLGAALLFLVQPLVAKLMLPDFRRVGHGVEHQLAVLPAAAAPRLRLRPRHHRRLGARWQPRLHSRATAARSSPRRSRSPSTPLRALARRRAVAAADADPDGRPALPGPVGNRTAAAALVLLVRRPARRRPLLPVRGSNLGSFVGLLAYPFLIEPTSR